MNIVKIKNQIIYKLSKLTLPHEDNTWVFFFHLPKSEYNTWVFFFHLPKSEYNTWVVFFIYLNLKTTHGCFFVHLLKSEDNAWMFVFSFN
jgi:hypothetical protein